MANYKAKVNFTSKAGEIKKDQEFNVDKTHGEFLVNMGYAEFISDNEEEKEALPLGENEDHK